MTPRREDDIWRWLPVVTGDQLCSTNTVAQGSQADAQRYHKTLSRRNSAHIICPQAYKSTTRLQQHSPIRFVVHEPIAVHEFFRSLLSGKQVDYFLT